MDKRDSQQKSSSTALRYRSEPALQTAIVQTLRANGLSIDEQVTCATGAADLVATHRDTIFEVKLWLSRKALQQAVGQLLLYRQAINPNARIVIVGYATTETAALRPHVEALGIEVVCWQDQSEITHWVPKDATYRTWDHETSEPLGSRIQTASTLNWRVAQQARNCGIPSVRELSFTARINRQSLYPIWNGTSKSVSLDMLARLCMTLGANPGHWFRWNDRELIWNVRDVAEDCGMTMRELVWAAEILPHSLSLIWRGEQQFIYIETLNKLARALNLATGDLFEWQELRV